MGATVDIVLATNRASPFLDEAIASVLAQDYPHWTLVVVDDGSPTPEFVRSAIADVPNAIAVRQPASGLSAARNRGMAEGRGQFVAFLDDDDVWAPTKLSRQVAAAVALPDSVAAYSAGWYLDEDGVRFGDGWSVAQTPSSSILSGATPAPRIVTLMVRRDVAIEMGGFNETYRASEDNEFIMRLAMRGEMVAVPEALVGYRRHSFNVSQGISLAARAEKKRLLVEQREQATQRGDVANARLIAANLQRFREAGAAESLAALREASRARDSRRIAEEVMWVIANAPRETLRLAVRKVSARLR
jgi:glycosyltransferase involved in cell wall biosynthesis